MEVIPTVGVLIIREGKVLLVKHTKKAGHIEGVYGLPAGRVEVGESLEQAAVRELFEETGYRCNISDLQRTSKEYIADIPRADGSMKRYSMVVFIVDMFTGELRSDSETTPEWVERDKITTLPLLPNLLEIVRSYISN